MTEPAPTAAHEQPYDGPLAPDTTTMYAARVLCPKQEPCAACVDRVLDYVAHGQSRTLIAEMEGRNG